MPEEYDLGLLGPDAEEALRGHLEALLPLRNPSCAPERNGVIAYADAALRAMGRRPRRDTHDNLHAPPTGGAVGGRRAVVAHTDSVFQEYGEDREPFEVSSDGVYRSRRFRRPLGGDDKCGVAVALTLAARLPEVGCILTADEEVGYVGALSLEGPRHDLLVQCDRRGGGQMVHTMRLTQDVEVRVLSPEAEAAARLLLPHRASVAGGGTDAGVLLARGLARNAVNLATGYVDPHTRGEFVVWADVVRALHDAAVLLRFLPPDLPPALPR